MRWLLLIWNQDRGTGAAAALSASQIGPRRSLDAFCCLCHITNGGAKDNKGKLAGKPQANVYSNYRSHDATRSVCSSQGFIRSPYGRFWIHEVTDRGVRREGNKVSRFQPFFYYVMRLNHSKRLWNWLVVRLIRLFKGPRSIGQSLNLISFLKPHYIVCYVYLSRPRFCVRYIKRTCLGKKQT